MVSFWNEIIICFEDFKQEYGSIIRTKFMAAPGRIWRASHNNSAKKKNVVLTTIVKLNIVIIYRGHK